MLFLFKIILTPVLVALVSIAARRWGPTVAALLIGFPWMTGPVLLFLGLEYGDTYIVRTATGVLIGAVSIGFALLVFANVVKRASWPWALLSVFAAYGFAGYMLNNLQIPLWFAALLAVASLVGASFLMPRPDVSIVPPQLPWWDIPMRMIATALLVTIIIVSADFLPPELVGVVSSYPVIVTVVGAFTHARWGWQPAVKLIRGVSLSLLSFVAFFLTLGATIEHIGLIRAFMASALAGFFVSSSFVVFPHLRVKMRAFASKQEKS